MPVKINLKINRKKASISPYRKKKKKNDKWVSWKKKKVTTKFLFF